MNATQDTQAFEPLWSVKETAQYLKMSTSWVYRHTESGEIPHAKLGGVIRYNPVRIREYEAQQHAIAKGGNVIKLSTRRR
jgi:excisionase family DNA binding protein